MDVVSRNCELKPLNKSCGNVNRDESDESHSIAVEVLASLLSGTSYQSENVKQQIDLPIYPPLNLNDGYAKEMSSFANLPSGKSMVRSYLQPTVTSNNPVFNTKSQYQYQPHILISEANKTCPFVLSTSIPLTTSKSDLTLPIETDTTNDSNLPYLNKDSMMKIHPDNVDSLLIVKRTSNDSKMYKVKKVKIDEILNILNDNRTRKSSILSNVSSDDSCSKKSELLTKKRLMAQFAANSTNQSRENFSRLFHFPDFRINTDSMDDSQHLKNTIGLFSRNSLENRTKSCLPLKKRKIKSTFQATKPFKPHNTNVSVVTGRYI
ncbi:Hypothetical predicted protein [Octopus vulgaris]|uniref:Uncharacterized protein n=1 Tax=Octopus vulgaris TaxID=6645 RepID=A0AA36AUG8_OCTVU|nr:Hypothetical predicted protein [Octopus vulgaris]